jgi:lipopolysaccharide/colanic/teichoic acid biosynthesis glycosyltransferase
MVGLAMASPLLAAIAVGALIAHGRPILFRDGRGGLRGNPFTLLKFRTMTDDRDALGELLPDARRLTELGHFLRTTSLDELPQLWNVLKGDMSLVGPRPLPLRYLPRYAAWQRRRHDVKPGITGWAQVNGRNALTWERKFELDVWYIDNWSLGLDIKILWLTLQKVFRRHGISQEGHATMPEFSGTTEGAAEPAGAHHDGSPARSARADL